MSKQSPRSLRDGDQSVKMAFFSSRESLGPLDRLPLTTAANDTVGAAGQRLWTSPQIMTALPGDGRISTHRSPGLLSLENAHAAIASTTWQIDYSARYLNSLWAANRIELKSHSSRFSLRFTLTDNAQVNRSLFTDLIHWRISRRRN